jgi:hypothetical protein
MHKVAEGFDEAACALALCELAGYLIGHEVLLQALIAAEILQYPLPIASLLTLFVDGSVLAWTSAMENSL